jgi:hypothetical protein
MQVFAIILFREGQDAPKETQRERDGMNTIQKIKMASNEDILAASNKKIRERAERRATKALATIQSPVCGAREIIIVAECRKELFLALKTK